VPNGAPDVEVFQVSDTSQRENHDKVRIVVSSAAQSGKPGLFDVGGAALSSVSAQVFKWRSSIFHKLWAPLRVPTHTPFTNNYLTQTST